MTVSREPTETQVGLSTLTSAHKLKNDTVDLALLITEWQKGNIYCRCSGKLCFKFWKL